MPRTHTRGNVIRIKKHTMIHKIFLISIILTLKVLYAQYTQIPDPVFEQRLINQGIDTEGVLDGQVLTADIENITLLNVSTNEMFENNFIHNLTGIEGFVSLEDLRFSNNKVDRVDLSNLSNLKILICKSSGLTSLNLSNNTMLEIINIDNCPPGICQQENTLTEIDLSNNVNLKNFFSANNYFYELDFSNNHQLESLYIHANLNQTTLNIKNGNNVLLNQLIIYDNPNLTCITVDDPVAATNGDTAPYDNWNVQEGISYSEDCSMGIGEYSQSDIYLHPNPVRDVLYIENTGGAIRRITVYDVLGKTVCTEEKTFDQLNLSGLKSGVFFVKTETEGGVITKKIIHE